MSLDAELLQKTQSLKVAVIHDWLITRRGGEKVLENILDLIPHADVYTLFGTPENVLRCSKWKGKYAQSFLSQFPMVNKVYKYLLPLMPAAIESIDLTSYDLIVSSSHCVAKGVVSSPHAVHVSYIHSPMRYAWDQEHRYFKKAPTFLRPIEILRRCLLSLLRTWDVTSAVRVTELVANSQFVADRCKLYWGKKAQVIYPPVDIDRFVNLPRHSPQSAPSILLFGAWVPYKRMLYAVETCLNAGFKVVAAGAGEELKLAKHRFGGHKNIEFVENPSDKKVEELYASCRVLLFPAVEDFGIVPVEAIASGMVVVAPGVGGTRETVVEGLNGFYFTEGDSKSMLNALQKALDTHLKEENLDESRKWVKRFSVQMFRNRFAESLINILDRTKKS